MGTETAEAYDAHKESVYDRKLAPELARLGALAAESGMSLIARVEWGPFAGGSTIALQRDASIAVRMVELATRANGNIDDFLFAVMRYARVHGHQSICLKQLGIEVMGKIRGLPTMEPTNRQQITATPYDRAVP